MMNQGNDMAVDHDEEDQSKASLIVNYLPKNFTQEDLRNLFSSIGRVESCTLMRDKEERCSLGYGFVNFLNEEDAQKAIEQLNGFKLESKIIKVSFARPCSDAIKGTNIYVAGLPFNITDNEFLSVFNKFGGIIDHRILRPSANLDPNTARSAALIRYDKRNEALTAIEQCNGKTPPGMISNLIVRFANNPRHKAQKRSFLDFMTIDHRPGKMMVAMNKPFPPPYPPPMITNGRINDFQDPMKRNHNFQLYPSPHQLNPMRDGEFWPLFVFNVNTNVEEKDLWQLFGPFGAIKSIKIIKEKAFAFVNMVNRIEAEYAIQALDGISYKDRTLQVSFKK